MAVLSKIREKSPKVLITVAAAFFIILIVFDWGLDLTGRRGRRAGLGGGEVLGTVNGQEIDYKQFTELVRRAEENQRKQQGGDLDDETDRQIRSQVWNQVVDQMLVDEAVKRLRITVSDQEIRDVLMGPNPPEFLVQQFKDSTGTFRRDAYMQAMRDPQNRELEIQVEDMVRQQLKMQKLQNLLLATINVSDDELKQRYIDRNTILNAAYVLFDVNRLVPDSAVTVTESDLRKQYEIHSGDFQTKASRKVKYVFFTQSPNADDTTSVVNEAKRLMDDARSGTQDFLDIVKTFSDVPPTDAYYKHGELSRQKENAVFSAKKGEIVGPVIDYDGVHVIKILDQRPGKEMYVRASHILLTPIPGPDSGKALQKAREILRQAREGADFAQLAREYSQDYGSAQQGGDLGWNSRGGWVKPFADAAFGAGVGQIVGPIRSQFGWHIIKVTGRDNREVKIADLAMKIKASSQTIDAAVQSAQDFQGFAKDEGFEKAAENSKYEVRETPEFTKTGPIAGLGQNDNLTNFAFNGKLGALSDPIYVRGGVIIAKISSVREDGLRPLDEVTPILRPMALKEKKMEKIRDQVDAFYKTLTPANDLLAAAQSVPNVIAQTTGPFRPGDPSIPGVGRDLAFSGTALALKAGELSKPFEGARGYYIIKMVSRSDFDTTQFNAQRDMLRQQILQERRSAALSEWQTALRDKADIVDHRDKFYR